MQRRDIIKSLAVLPLAVATTTGQGSASPDDFTYKGYRVWWTGWKDSRDTPRIVGQWLGYPLGHDENLPFLYSSVPGGHGEYVKGQSFDITCRAPQEWLQYSTPDDIKEREKTNGLPILKHLIDERT